MGLVVSELVSGQSHFGQTLREQDSVNNSWNFILKTVLDSPEPPLLKSPTTGRVGVG